MSFAELLKEVEEKIERRELSICEELRKYLPSSERTEQWISICYEVVDKLRNHGLVTIQCPTGAGKTMFLTAFSIVQNIFDKVIFFTWTRLARLKLINWLKEWKERGLITKPILVFLFPKYELCINENVLTEMKNKLQQGYSTSEVLTWLYRFACSKCKYNDVNKASKIVENFQLKNDVYVTDKSSIFYELGIKNGICPFLLIKHLMKNFDIIILDYTHLWLLTFSEVPQLIEKSLVIFDEAHVYALQFLFKTISLDVIKLLAKKFGESMEDIDKVINKISNLANVRYEEVKKRYRDVDFVIIFDEDASSVIANKIIKLSKIVDEAIRNGVIKATRSVLRLLLIASFIEKSIQYFPMHFKCFVCKLSKKRKEKWKIYFVYGRPIKPIRAKGLIISSATITSYDVSLISRRPIEEVEKTFITKGFGFERETYLIEIPCNLQNRETIVKLLKEICEKVKIKPIFTATLSWLDEYLIKEISEIKYYKIVDNLEEALKIINELKNLIGKVPILISVYSRYAISLDLVDPDKPFTAFVIAVENPPSIYSLRDQLYLNYFIYRYLMAKGINIENVDEHTLTKARRYATLFTMIKVGIYKTMQAIGRFERTPKIQKLKILLIGMHWKYLLPLLKYLDMYGEVKKINNIEELIKVINYG